VSPKALSKVCLEAIQEQLECYEYCQFTVLGPIDTLVCLQASILSEEWDGFKFTLSLSAYGGGGSKDSESVLGKALKCIFTMDAEVAAIQDIPQ
jgi:hypothetical protein